MHFDAPAEEYATQSGQNHVQALSVIKRSVQPKPYSTKQPLPLPVTGLRSVTSKVVPEKCMTSQTAPKTKIWTAIGCSTFLALLTTNSALINCRQWQRVLGIFPHVFRNTLRTNWRWCVLPGYHTVKKKRLLEKTKTWNTGIASIGRFRTSQLQWRQDRSFCVDTRGTAPPPFTSKWSPRAPFQYWCRVSIKWWGKSIALKNLASSITKGPFAA